MEISKRPWYREPYVWLVILFPTIAVIGGIITFHLAVWSQDGLVVDDYYKQGLQINRLLARDQAAASHGLQATFHFNEETHLIRLYLTANPNYPLPSQIELNFSHHTRSNFDKHLVLQRGGKNFYQAALPELIPGAWYVELAADDWRLLKSLRVPLTVREWQISSSETRLLK